MKWNRLSFLLVVLLSACAQLSYNYTKEITIQNIPCIGRTTYYKVSGNSEFYPENKLKSCHLAKDLTLNNYLFHKNSVLFFNQDGTLGRCITSEPTTFGHLLLPAESNVFFNRWGESINFWLPRPSIIQGYLISKSTDGIGNSCYTSGKLKEFWLENDEVIQGIPCTTSGNPFKVGWQASHFGSDRRIRLFEDGTLERAMLSADFTYQGKQYKKGELLYLKK